MSKGGLIMNNLKKMTYREAKNKNVCISKEGFDTITGKNGGLIKSIFRLFSACITEKRARK